MALRVGGGYAEQADQRARHPANSRRSLGWRMRRVLAWAEMFALFALLYVGIPWAGLTVDRVLGITALPSPARWVRSGPLVLGIPGLAWCFPPVAGHGRRTPI